MKQAVEKHKERKRLEKSILINQKKYNKDNKDLIMNELSNQENMAFTKPLIPFRYEFNGERKEQKSSDDDVPIPKSETKTKISEHLLLYAFLKFRVSMELSNFPPETVTHYNKVSTYLSTAYDKYIERHTSCSPPKKIGLFASHLRACKEQFTIKSTDNRCSVDLGKCHLTNHEFDRTRLRSILSYKLNEEPVFVEVCDVGINYAKILWSSIRLLEWLEREVKQCQFCAIDPESQANEFVGNTQRQAALNYLISTAKTILMN